MSLDIAIDHLQGAFRLDVAFRAGPGLTALYGRSGSGKSTLVNAIAGLVKPRSGRIVVDGAVLLDTERRIDVPTHRRRIGYVFQEGRLFPHLSVRQNLLYGRRFGGRRREGESLERVVDLLGIGHLLARGPAGLSGGEKQRVAIGRALLAAPRILLMDEPLASLDEARKHEIMPHIERLRDESGLPIVYVSHALAEVTRLATSVVLLERGRVAATGTPAEILGTSAEARAILARGERGTVIAGRVVAADDGFGLSRLATPAGELLVPRTGRAQGAQARVFVRARDVVLALDPPSRVSALNILRGTVRAVREDPAAGEEPWAEVEIACGGAMLLARVTRRSLRDLDLAPGRTVFALLKAAALDEEDEERRVPHAAPEGDPWRA